MNLDPDSEELLTFDPNLNGVEIKLVQLAPYPTAQLQFTVRTALYSGGLIQGSGNIYYFDIYGAVTKLQLQGFGSWWGWCDNKNDIISHSLATSVTWTFAQRPYARAKGDQWTADAVFYEKYRDCFYRLTQFDWEWPLLIEKIDKVRVTITNWKRNYAQYFRVEYRVLNCEYFDTFFT